MFDSTIGQMCGWGGESKLVWKLLIVISQNCLFLLYQVGRQVGKQLVPLLRLQISLKIMQMTSTSLLKFVQTMKHASSLSLSLSLSLYCQQNSFFQFETTKHFNQRPAGWLAGPAGNSTIKCFDGPFRAHICLPRIQQK